MLFDLLACARCLMALSPLLFHLRQVTRAAAPDDQLPEAARLAAKSARSGAVS